MSFSGDVKEELSKHISQARHCQIAELSAIVHYCGRIVKRPDKETVLLLETENEAVYRKAFTLLKKTFNIDSAVLNKGQENGDKQIKSVIELTSHDEIWNLFGALKLIDMNGVFRGLDQPVNSLLIKNACCKRAFLRGTFLCIGSMSDPAKGYHLEIAAQNEPQAQQIQEVLSDFDLEAKIIQRKRYFVVYLKEGAGIVDFLNICEAHVALMNLENLRIVKEMRNSINRRVNCEAANITKTVNASAKQIAEITLIRDHYGFQNLPDNLREMAEVRMEYPDLSLNELGQYLNPPVGKSGVNHRLRKLSEIAQEVEV